MLEIGLQALSNLLQPDVFVFLMLGVLVGTVVGILPGLGGIVGMSVLLPFIFGMDPTAGLALLIGMTAITQTADTFTSVLLGVPGSAGSQATIMDGYPMATQGRGAEALGAGFLASLLGGLVAAMVLFGAISVARPVILAFGSPQLFMLVLLGLSMVGILSRGAPRAGLLAGMIGLILGAVGGAPTAPVYRFTFDQIYLFDGIPLAVLAIGLFAIPELVDLLVQQRAVAAEKLRGSMLSGMAATVRHKWLVVRSSAIGSLIGMLPGLGGSVVDWIAYGIASQTSKNNERFGRGDIRGVIAPESANNAKEGGTLIPTLLFGIPGSGSTAILLGGFTLLGIQAGPRLVTDNMPLVMSIVWMLALANVIGAALCLVLSRWIVKLTQVPAAIFGPFLIVLLFTASYQSSRHWGDIISLIVIGLVGWMMKQIGWPRPPLLIGFVLAVPAERYLWTSTGTYGYSWLLKPSVIAIGLVILVILGFGFRLRRRIDSTVQASKEPEDLRDGEH
jgi:putative tricarboxylic transport membrane protein